MIPLRYLAIPVLLLCLLLASGSGVMPAQAGPVTARIAPWVIEHTAGGQPAEFLVVLADQADLRGAQGLATKLQKGRYVRDALWNKAQTTQAPLLNWLAARGVEYRSFYVANVIWVKGDQNLALALAARPDVARIESNPQIQMALPPAGAESPYSVLAIESNISYVRAPDVWAMGFTGQGIVVGGQDTGYQWDHPALKPQYRGWNGTTADHNYNWHDSIHSGGGTCGADSLKPCDDNNHGTHTMGTVVGSDGGSNQIGMAPGAKWIGCRNMDQGAGKPSTYLECFEFFLAPYPVGGTPAQGDPSKAPDVTNNSWACPTTEGCAWDALKTAVENQRAAGIMTVVSAGNDGPSCSTVQDPPAIYAAAYSVGALNKGTDTIASFSSRGPVTVDGSNRREPDISAPGTSIRSSIRGGGYGTMSGTSMAGPHVAGAVALLWSARPELKHQVASTEQILNDSAVHISSSACSSSGWPNNTYGYGRLDVKAAVDAGTGPTPTPTTGPSPTPTFTPTPTATPTSTPRPSNTGWLNPTANAAVTSSAGDNNGFEVNPTNAYADDGLFAVDNNSGTNSNSSCTNAGKDKHRLYNYSVTLPGGAAVKGIQVRLDARADSTSGSPKICIQLSWDGGATWTSAKSTSTLTTAEATYLLGGAADTWGRTWTASQLGNSTFRVRMIDVATSTSRDFYLDWVAVQVTYQ